MKFSVCIKQVPDVNAPIHLQGGKLDQGSARMVLNAYDASAVEEALVLTEAHGGDVDVVMIGGGKATETMRKALAMGAGTGTLISAENASELDSRQVAETLAAHFNETDFEVILTGKQSQDTDSGLAGSMLAEKLNLPYTTNAVGIQYETDANKLVVTRQGDTGQEIIAMPIPCIISCSNDMNNPRIPSVKGIMKSKRKKVAAKNMADLAGDLSAMPKTVVLGYEAVPSREAGEKFEGEAVELADKLTDLLQNDAGML